MSRAMGCIDGVRYRQGYRLACCAFEMVEGWEGRLELR